VTNAHVSEEQLELYAVGKLSGEALDSLEDHLMVCSGCRTRLEEMDEYVATMRAGLRRVNAAERPTPLIAWPAWARDWRALSAAGAMAVLLVALLSPRLNLTEPRPELYSDVSLESARGLESVAHMPAGRGAALALDIATVEERSGLKAEVVDGGGGSVWSAPVTVDGQRGLVRVERALNTGTYWVRLFNSQGRQLREYALRVDPQ
jgi:anti-sigma factor RsiW